MRARRGVLFLMLLFTVLGTAVLFAALSLRHPGGVVSAGTVLVFDVPYQLEEGDAPSRPFSLGFGRRHRYFLHDVLEGLRRARRDDRVEALVVHIDDLDWGWAKVYEVRDAIQQFRSEGKPVYAVLDGGGELEYLLASVADEIVTAPTVTLQLDGLTASAMFLRGTLDKLDVTPNFAHAGRYKSAVEEYTRSSMSGPAREALDALLGDLYQTLVDSLATARGFTPEDVALLLDHGPYTAEGAFQAGLVDTLLYDAVADSLALGDGSELLDFDRYLDRLLPSRGGPRIALIAATGTILPGRSRSVPGGESVMGAETMIEALRAARERDAIRAVVLRIDSPGGAIQAADEIWSEVRRLADEKPVIVSMSDVAASGGYYIAAPASYIVADPATITGSIGVFGGKMNVIGLFNKLGITVETLSRGTRAGMMSPYRDFTPDERELYQRQIEDSYRIFLDRVAEGRHMAASDVDSVGQGRVWSGLAAWEIGLVDTLGGLETAVSLALDEAGISRRASYVVEVLPRVEHRWYESIFEDLFGDPESLDAKTAVLSPVARAWLTAARLEAGTTLALMPFSIQVR